MPDINARVIFENTLRFLYGLVSRTLARIENGSLQRYICLLLLAVIVVLVAGLTPLSRITGEVALTPVDPLTALGLLVMAGAALLTMGFHRQRLTALLMLSVVGLIVAMVFARFSAPDLALTQLVVEVVTILLMLLVVYFLPAKAPAESSSLLHLRDFSIAASCGVLMAVLTFAVLTRPYQSIADFFLANSLLGGLAARQVRATFMLCGYRIADYPGVARRIWEQGHEIAIHHRHLLGGFYAAAHFDGDGVCAGGDSG